LRIICIGAHPDDCEIEFAGTAAKFVAGGHAVKFVSVTNGASGHQVKFGPEIVETRRHEANEGGKRLGVSEVTVLNAPDGALQPTVEMRTEVIRLIRKWKADLVISHRAWDYHPDHRYASQLVQDAAYMVLVPAVCPDTPPLEKNPVFLYLEDRFQLPVPFKPDIAVDVDDVWDKKVSSMDAHVSQFYEWLPWVARELHEVPADAGERLKWLSRTRSEQIKPTVRAALNTRYGAKADQITHAESFQLCEYGRQPTPAELDELFPR
jgi:LmbE family N-acetylglucosaminyl deacetylase